MRMAKFDYAQFHDVDDSIRRDYGGSNYLENHNTVDHMLLISPE